MVNDEEQNKYEINIAKLKEEYPNAVGWLQVKGTNIDSPITQYDDNNYYLDHSIDDSQNSAGWMFVDYKNKLDGTDKNIIIYGHNRRDGSQFGSLQNILNSEWYDNEENKYIFFTDQNGCAKYEVFSVYQIEDEDYYITTEFDDDEFSSFITRLENRSIKDFDTEVTSNDSILTLSTCGNNNKYRVVLHAKKVTD